jgi:hypothetical protein
MSGLHPDLMVRLAAERHRDAARRADRNRQVKLAREARAQNPSTSRAEERPTSGCPAPGVSP